jgi:hypothetical protein
MELDMGNQLIQSKSSQLRRLLKYNHRSHAFSNCTAFNERIWWTCEGISKLIFTTLINQHAYYWLVKWKSAATEIVVIAMLLYTYGYHLRCLKSSILWCLDWSKYITKLKLDQLIFCEWVEQCRSPHRVSDTVAVAPLRCSINRNIKIWKMRHYLWWRVVVLAKMSSITMQVVLWLIWPAKSHKNDLRWDLLVPELRLLIDWRSDMPDHIQYQSGQVII